VNAKEAIFFEDINFKTSDAKTPLLYAIFRKTSQKERQEAKEIVALLIANGADVNAMGGEYPTTPLHAAASSGQKEIAELLIANGADVNAKQSMTESTPLHDAASGGIYRESRKEIIELLIQKGSDVNAKDHRGGTPLHDAAYDGLTENAKVLVTMGADVNAKDRDGDTPLDRTFDHWYYREVKAHNNTAALLRQYGGKSGIEDSIFTASKFENVEAIERLIAKGMDVNAKSRNKWVFTHHDASPTRFATPLHIAADRGNKQIMELLIANGANINAQDEDGRTPMDVAPWNLRAVNLRGGKIVELLRKHGGKTGEELKAAGK